MNYSSLLTNVPAGQPVRHRPTAGFPGLFTSVRPYLPYTAATSQAGTALGAAGFGSSRGVSGGNPLPFAVATALLAAMVVVLAAVAARTTVRRDIA